MYGEEDENEEDADHQEAERQEQGHEAQQQKEADVKYPAQERKWVMRLLARLNPDQRRRYEKACKEYPYRHPNSGKLFDGYKAEIAERILYEDSLCQPQSGPVSDG